MQYVYESQLRLLKPLFRGVYPVLSFAVSWLLEVQHIYGCNQLCLVVVEYLAPIGQSVEVVASRTLSESHKGDNRRDLALERVCLCSSWRRSVQQVSCSIRWPRPLNLAHFSPSEPLSNFQGHFPQAKMR